jgi:hypothetical protein
LAAFRKEFVTLSESGRHHPVDQRRPRVAESRSRSGEGSTAAVRGDAVFVGDPMADRLD